MLKKIKALAQARNVTIAEVERACGLSHSSIMKWEDCSPRADNLKKIADYFGVSVDYFLSEEKTGACYETPQ